MGTAEIERGYLGKISNSLEMSSSKRTDYTKRMRALLGGFDFVLDDYMALAAACDVFFHFESVLVN